MNIEDAIRFVVEEVEDPALEHPSLEDPFKNKVKLSKTIVHRIKKIGDLYRYLKRFEFVPPIEKGSDPGCVNRLFSEGTGPLFWSFR